MPLLEHDDLIRLVRVFAPAISEKGVCDGFISMWIQAILTGPNEEKEFYDRLDRISDYLSTHNVDHLKKELSEIFYTQKSALEEYEVTLEENLNQNTSFDKKIYLKQIVQPNGKVTLAYSFIALNQHNAPEEVKGSINLEEEKDRLTNQTLQSVKSKILTKITEAKKSLLKKRALLTKDALLKIDIQAFAESVALQHDPSILSHSTNNAVLSQKEKSILYPLTASQALITSHEYEIDLLSNLAKNHSPTLKNNTIYLEKEGNKLKYVYLNPEDPTKQIQGELNIEIDGALTQEKLPALKTKVS
jgi:hypothetical protein